MIVLIIDNGNAIIYDNTLKLNFVGVDRAKIDVIMARFLT